ncbi:hypothetical protein AQ921_06925 [Burkholderia pseudomallei]|nr:hypothetical protein AQ921_06925 [Burkholderia pseudomallei]
MRDELGQDESIFGVRFARIVVVADDFECLDCGEGVLCRQQCGLLDRGCCGEFQRVANRQDHVTDGRNVLSKRSSADFVIARAFRE